MKISHNAKLQGAAVILLAGGLTLGVGASPAMAASGNVDNSWISGSWNYSWTHSTASAYAKKSAGANAQACQDGICNQLSTRVAHQGVTANRNGSSTNHNDSARVW